MWLQNYVTNSWCISKIKVSEAKESIALLQLLNGLAEVVQLLHEVFFLLFWVCYELEQHCQLQTVDCLSLCYWAFSRGVAASWRSWVWE